MSKWTIKATTIKPYWINQNGFKPHPTTFEHFKNFKMRKIKANINFIDFFNAEIVLPNNNKNYYYFELTNDETREVKFFYTHSVKVVQGSQKVFNLILDVYTTYTIPFIERNKDVNVIQNRSQQWSPKLLLREDQLIKQLPILYSKWTLTKLPFPSKIEKYQKWFYGPEIALSNANNAYKYAVFNTGSCLSYTAFPILQGNVKLDLGKQGPLNFKYTAKQVEWSGAFGGRTDRSDDALQVGLNEAYRQNKIVKIQYQWPYHEEYNWQTRSYEINLEPGIDLYRDFKYEIHSQIILHGSGLALVVDLKLKYKDRVINSDKFRFQSRKDPSLNDVKDWLNKNLHVTAEVFDRVSGSVQTFGVNCTESTIEGMLKKPEYSNKFLGIYAGPHLLQLKAKNLLLQNIEIGGNHHNVISININKDGLEINPYVFNIPRKESLYWNSPNYSTACVQLTNYKYRNASVDINKLYLNGQYQLGGRVIFSNGFKIISKQNDLLSVQESIIDYGGMLPTAENEYTKLVNSQINTINTGYEIQKQMYDFQKTSNILNSIQNVFSLGGSITSMLNHPFSGGGGVIGSMFGLTNTIRNGRLIDMQFNNYKKQLVAQFRDSYNTNGNSIKMSNVIDASIVTYYEHNSEQFECLEQNVLDETTNIFVNNFVYLYGYADPYKTNFKELLDLSNPYIEIAPESIENTGNLLITEEPNIWMMIKEQLINGLKLFSDVDFEKVNLPESYQDNPPVSISRIDIEDTNVTIDLDKGLIELRNETIEWTPGLSLNFVNEVNLTFKGVKPRLENFKNEVIYLKGASTINNEIQGPLNLNIFHNDRCVVQYDPKQISFPGDTRPIRFQFNSFDDWLEVDDLKFNQPKSLISQTNFVGQDSITYHYYGEMLNSVPLVSVMVPKNNQVQKRGAYERFLAIRRSNNEI